jgi:hypothetical protein
MLTLRTTTPFGTAMTRRKLPRSLASAMTWLSGQPTTGRAGGTICGPPSN